TSAGIRAGCSSVPEPFFLAEVLFLEPAGAVSAFFREVAFALVFEGFSSASTVATTGADGVSAALAASGSSTAAFLERGFAVVLRALVVAVARRLVVFFGASDSSWKSGWSAGSVMAKNGA